MEEHQTPTSATRETVDNLMIESLDDSASKDFEFTRANLKEIITNGGLTLEKLTLLAERMQHPRAYEVLAKMTDSIVNANKELMELQVKIRYMKDLSAKVNGPTTRTINQTAIFVGSTAELQRNLKKTLKGMNMIDDSKDEEKDA